MSSMWSKSTRLSLSLSPFFIVLGEPGSMLITYHSHIGCQQRPTTAHSCIHSHICECINISDNYITFLMWYYSGTSDNGPSHQRTTFLYPWACLCRAWAHRVSTRMVSLVHTIVIQHLSLFSYLSPATLVNPLYSYLYHSWQKFRKCLNSTNHSWP